MVRYKFMIHPFLRYVKLRYLASKPMYLVFIANFLIIQSIHGANHGVGWYHVGASVGDDIRGHHMRDVLQLMENIKAFQYDEQLVVHEGACQSGIANPVGGV